MKKIPKNSRVLFFKDKPLFGMDIGHDELRVVQLDLERKVPKVLCYGSIAFDPLAIADGLIVKPELVAKAALRLFKKELVGEINTNRVAISLPASHAYTRSIQLPKMSTKDVREAVLTEIEQYVPQGLDSLYIDYAKIRETADQIEIFVVGMSKQIVDSYIDLTRILGLEAVLFETTIGASSNLLALDRHTDIPTLLIDFGSTSTDITLYSSGLIVTGTVGFGGDDITQTLKKALDITDREALVIKGSYGLSASPLRKRIMHTVEPSLELLLKEIRRTLRYYEQRYNHEAPIGQVVTMGGGANMPGINDYLTDKLRLPTRGLDPTVFVDFGKLHPFLTADKMSYVTAVGLSIIKPREIFQ